MLFSSSTLLIKSLFTAFFIHPRNQRSGKAGCKKNLIGTFIPNSMNSACCGRDECSSPPVMLQAMTYSPPLLSRNQTNHPSSSFFFAIQVCFDCPAHEPVGRSVADTSESCKCNSRLQSISCSNGMEYFSRKVEYKTGFFSIAAETGNMGTSGTRPR